MRPASGSVGAPGVYVIGGANNLSQLNTTPTAPGVPTMLSIANPSLPVSVKMIL